MARGKADFKLIDAGRVSIEILMYVRAIQKACQKLPAMFYKCNTVRDN